MQPIWIDYGILLSYYQQQVRRRPERRTKLGMHCNVVHEQPFAHHSPRRGAGAGAPSACAATGRSRGEIVLDALRRQLQLTDDDVFASVS
jgi:hypothetical protein